MDQTVAPEIRTTPYQSPMNQYGGSILMMTDTSNELRELEMTMRGLYEVDGKLEQLDEPMMNDAGIRRVIGMTRSFVHRITIMGKLSNNQVEKWGKYFSYKLINELMNGRTKYDIKNPWTSRSTIVGMANAIVFFTMQRALDQGDRIFWSKSHQDIRTEVVGNRNKEGMFSRIMGWTR